MFYFMFVIYCVRYIFFVYVCYVKMVLLFNFVSFIKWLDIKVKVLNYIKFCGFIKIKNIIFYLNIYNMYFIYFKICYVVMK